MLYKVLRFLAPLLILGVLFGLGSTAMASPAFPNDLCGINTEFDPSGLAIKKEVFCENENAWDWVITKIVDPTSLELAVGASAPVDYTVNASAAAHSRKHIYGTITIVNYNPQTVTITSVSDSLGPVTCPVTFPLDLPVRGSITCSYSFRSPTVFNDNTATVTTASGLNVSTVAPIDWALAADVVTDECVLVSDTFAGDLGTACAGTQTSFDFYYTLQIGPYPTCGDYTVENTATFTTLDSGTSGSASASVDVDVPCVDRGCTRSHGYWKVRTIHGPAPYDPTWDARGGGDAEFLETGRSYYEVLWTSSSDGNAYIILSHPYIGAELNQLAGASIPPEVYAAFSQATALLTTYQDTMTIPEGPERTLALSLALTLNKYNVGILGPGQCAQTNCGSRSVSFDGLGVSKTVYCEMERSWTWEIEKIVDQPVVFLPPAESAPVNYTVTASALPGGTFYVHGQVEIRNLTGSSTLQSTAMPITIVSVSDRLAELTCSVTFPYDLAPSESILCTYEGTLTEQPGENIVKVVRENGETNILDVAIDWSHAAGTNTDECATISDTFAGELGNVCAGNQRTFTFNYPRQIGPYNTCGTYTEENTAAFTTNDSSTTGSDSAVVTANVLCETGCTLSQGYWKTHTIHGPAPYDDAWDARDGGDAEFLDTDLSYYEVLQTNPAGGNAYVILAHQFIAAEMNMLNGASAPAEVLSAFDQANALLVEYQYTLFIPHGDDRDIALDLADILENYNTGGTGPGHCPE